MPCPPMTPITVDTDQYKFFHFDDAAVAVKNNDPSTFLSEPTAVLSQVSDYDYFYAPTDDNYFLSELCLENPLPDPPFMVADQINERFSELSQVGIDRSFLGTWMRQNYPGSYIESTDSSSSSSSDGSSDLFAFCDNWSLPESFSGVLPDTQPTGPVKELTLSPPRTADIFPPSGSPSHAPSPIVLPPIVLPQQPGSSEVPSRTTEEQPCSILQDTAPSHETPPPSRVQTPVSSLAQTPAPSHKQSPATSCVQTPEPSRLASPLSLSTHPVRRPKRRGRPPKYSVQAKLNAAASPSPVASTSSLPPRKRKRPNNKKSNYEDLADDDDEDDEYYPTSKKAKLDDDDYYPSSKKAELSFSCSKKSGGCHKVAHGTRVYCHWWDEGVQSKCNKSFTRKADLQRHLKTAHCGQNIPELMKETRKSHRSWCAGCKELLARVDARIRHEGTCKHYDAAEAERAGLL